MAFISNLTTGMTYQATVTAVNEIGESPHSSQLALHAGTPPSKILTLLWESSSTTTVEFRWALPESNGGLPISSFRLYVDVGQTGAAVEGEVVDVFARTHQLTALTTGQLVDIQITSTNASGESVKSDVLTL